MYEPLSSGDLLRRPGWSFSVAFTSSTVPETGANYMQTALVGERKRRRLVHSQCPRRPLHSPPRRFGLTRTRSARALPDNTRDKPRTTLRNLSALLGELHVHDVAEARLGVVGDRDGADLRRVVVHDRLVVLGVLLRCTRVNHVSTACVYARQPAH